MINITVKRESGDIRLDLYVDTEIDITINNQFFTPDEVVTSHSLQINLPPTFNNLRAFGYPLTLASKSTIYSLPVVVSLNGMDIIWGTIEIDGCDKSNISTHLIGSSFECDTDVPLNELRLEQTILNMSTLIEDFKDIVMEAARGERNFYYAPICNGSNSNNLINKYDFTENKFVIEGAYSPAIKVSYLVEKLLGATAAEFFKSNELDKLCIISSYTHPGMLGLIDITKSMATLDLAHGAPSMSSGDFLIDIFRLLDLSLSFRGKDIIVSRRSDIINSKAVADWSSKIEEGYSISYIDGEEAPIVYSNKIDDVPDAAKNAIAADSFDHILHPYITDDPTCFVIPQGDIYSVRRTEAGQYNHSVNVVHNNFSGKESKSSSKLGFKLPKETVRAEMKTNHVPHPSTNPQFYAQVAVIDFSDNRDDAYLAMYHGGSYFAEGYFPLLTHNNRGSAGGLSLTLDMSVKGGIGEKHSSYYDFMKSNRMVVNGRVLLSLSEIRNIDFTKKVSVNNRDFIIKSIAYTLSNGANIEPCEVELECPI